MVSESSLPVILYVEDDPDDRMLFIFEVENSPWFQSIVQLNNSEELFNYMNRPGEVTAHSLDHPRHMILVNAFQFVREQKKFQAELSTREELKEIPIILMADSTFEADYFQLQSRSDIFAWLVKPINREKLSALIRRVTKGMQIVFQAYLPLRVIDFLIDYYFKMA